MPFSRRVPEARKLDQRRNVHRLAGERDVSQHQDARNFEPPATGTRCAPGAQSRKISGTTWPSRCEEAAFEHAVNEVTAVARQLLLALETSAPPRDREVERRKARARSQQRFGKDAAPAI